MNTIEQQNALYVPSIPHLSAEDVKELQVYRIHTLDKMYVFRSYQELVTIKQQLEEEQYFILSFISTHTSVRFNQLLYLLKGKFTRKKLNDTLQVLLYYRLIEKWQVELLDFEIQEEAYTLSDNGFKLLKYWQGSKFFFSPERLDNHGKYIHLRYWQDIELLCHLRYSPAFLSHIMHPVVNRGVATPPMCFQVKSGEQREINFVVYSTLMTDKKERLKEYVTKWKYHVESGKNIIIRDFDINPTVMIIFVSTIQQAKQINKELLLDLLPGTVLLCIGETLHTQGLQHAFYQPLLEGEVKQLNTKLFITE